MLNLLHHHRLHIPNGLAMFAALLLLASSAVAYKAAPDTGVAEQAAVTAAQLESGENQAGGEMTQQKRRGLNLGLLLFRR